MASRSLILAASFLPFLCSSPLSAAEHWIRLTTPHFEMYTTNGEKQATEALNQFEQVRYFFLQNSRWSPAKDAVVHILAFRSEKEYKPYRLNEGAFAYYMRSRKGDYIVMQDLNSEHYQAVMHEYTHLVVQHSELKLPVWLNEGLADLYSSLEPKGNQALVGRALPGRMSSIYNEAWLDLNIVFAAGQDSPYYNEKEKMSVFYSESWALTHMLALGENYTQNFSKFMAAVASGSSTADCLEAIYGKTTAQVTKDLQAYVHRASLRAAVFDIKLTKSEMEPEVTEPPELSVDLALADLLAGQKKSWEEASARLMQLAAAHPESLEAQESLGYLAWDQGNTQKARECFKRAYEGGSKNAEMVAHYAQLLHESGAATDQLLPVMRRALALSPEDQTGWLNLGATETQAAHYGAALSALSHIKKITPERAFPLFATEAYCYWQLKSPEQARELAERAKKYAQTPDQQYQISQLLKQLDSLAQEGTRVKAAATADPSAAAQSIEPADAKTKRVLARDEPSLHWPGNLQHVEAVAKFFDCGPKVHRLKVTVGSREMVFALDNPDRVLVRNGEQGHVDMQCGAQKPFPVGIFYIASTPPAAVDGDVRELVF